MDKYKLLYCYAVSLFSFSPLLPLHPFLLHVDLEPVLLWKGGMKDPSQIGVVHVSMEDTTGIRNTNGSCISEVSKDSTKGMWFTEFGTQVMMITIIISFVLVLVEGCI